MATPPPDEPHETGRGKIAAIGVIVVLIGVSLWLVHLLGNAASVQDCVSTGRANCAQGDTGGR